MSGTDTATSQRQTTRGRRAEPKTTTANPEVGEDEQEGNMANAIAQSVTAKISALMDTKFAELQVNLNALSSRIDDNSKRLSEAENRVSENEDRTVSLETKIALLEKKVQDLTTRADDIENRSRRDNIRVIGLKEGTEGNQAVEFFESWLPTTLGIKTKRGVIKIDRAHRSLGERQPNYNRPVIIKLHNSRDKRRILAAAKEKGEIICGNNKILIRQDFSQSVREARREFNDICEEMLEKKIRFRMQYPATLFITVQGKEHSFKSPPEAGKFLSRCEFPTATREDIEETA